MSQHCWSSVSVLAQLSLLVSCRSQITLMNLFWANPALMVSTALALWVELSLNHIVTSLTLTAATASRASFQLSSLKPSWIRREHGRNKSHYHTGLLHQCSMSTVLPIDRGYIHTEVMSTNTLTIYITTSDVERYQRQWIGQ